MKIMRKAAVAALAVSLAVAMTGCQAGADEGKTTLSWFSWDSESEVVGVIEEFERQNPDIVIDFSHAPPAVEYNDTLQKRLLGGTAADVFMINGENRGDLIAGQFVLDLTDQPFMDLQAQRDNGYSAEGHDFGLTTFSWGAGLVYNVEMLESVGMTTPPQTWDEFIALCDSLKAAGYTPFYESLPGSVSYFLAAMIGQDFSQKGGDVDARIFDGTSTFEEELTDVFTLYSDFYAAGLGSQANVGLSQQEALTAFATGQVAMIPTGPWDVATIEEAAPDMAFDMMGTPGVVETQAFFAGSSGASYAINAKTKNLEAAETFLTFLSSAKGAELYNEGAGEITTTTNFEAVVDPRVEPLAEALRESNVYWPVIGWKRFQGELNTVFMAVTQELAMGKITPAEAAKALDEKLTTLDAE
ncbi:ABC transporter substrate-binding protein [Microbacterium sp. A93]|uniref:ABC transporter substrate-binding protein n=1 Tax=Microbacterium sp. A93 TaxID=3450716 RepID=UPI003F434F0A